MSIKINEIAQRIKGLREINGVSEESLAKEFNLKVEDYKKYESGETDIPVSFLSLFANRFNVDLTSLITGKEPKLHTYCLVRKDKGPTVERRKEYKYQDLSYNFINKKCETFLVTVDPDNKKEINCYSHAGQEFNYVIEGSIKVNINGHEIILNEGDSLYFDSSNKHGMVALNNKKAKFLAVIM
jgi:quercetin dioxygenase-like cupin family protein